MIPAGQLGLHPNVLSAPLSVAVELTYACNLRCIHCMSGNKGAVYVRDAQAAEKVIQREMSTEAWTDLIDQMADAGVFLLYLSGGEPLVHPACIQLAAHATSRKLNVSLLTDSMLIDRDVALRLVDAGVRTIQTNLDGARAEVYDEFRGVPGAFEDTRRGIRAAVEAGLWVRINLTMTRKTMGELPQVVALARELGAREVIALPFRRAGRALRNQELELTHEEFEVAARGWRELAATLPRDFRFAFERGPEVDQVIDPGSLLPAEGGGRYQCNITPTGLVKLEPESPNEPEFIAGDLKRQRFIEVWRDSPLFRAMRDPDLPEYEPCLLGARGGACPARIDRKFHLPPEEACSYCSRRHRKESKTWSLPASTW